MKKEEGYVCFWPNCFSDFGGLAELAGGGEVFEAGGSQARFELALIDAKRRAKIGKRFIITVTQLHIHET